MKVIAYLYRERDGSYAIYQCGCENAVSTKLIDSIPHGLVDIEQIDKMKL